MSDAEDVTFSLKVMVNKERTKVLFAKVGNDFADILFSLLALPLGKIVQVLEKHYGNKTPVMGSLNTLYNGVANLDGVHFHRDEIKAMLLNPKSVHAFKFWSLKINLNNTEESDQSKENTTSYIIGDDLRVMPNMKCSIIDTLSNLGIAMEDMEGADTQNLTFGFSEMMDLLKMSFKSRSPLTDLILGNRELKSEHGSSTLHDEIEQEASSTSSKKVTLKVMLQKSTNKFLFAQADECFIDYLFSILSIPLGRVERLLGGKTCLKNIDNLYRSIADNATYDEVDWLIVPNLPQNMYTSNQLLPLCEYSHSPSFPSHRYGTRNMVKGRRMFMVTDNLTVAPLDLTSSISILNGMKISLSDVQELELDIGEQEALNIMKASLTSNAALTDALGLGLKQRVKQEY